MAFPTSKLALTATIAFDGVTPVDVTPWLQHESGIPRSHGRSGGGAKAASHGKVTFTLLAPRDDPGLLCPWDPESPYWNTDGWQGCPVVMTVEGEPWFSGQIVTVDMSIGLTMVTATIEAAGPLAKVSQAKPKRSLLYRTLQADEPIAHWPLNDGEDSAQAASALPSGAPLPTLEGAPEFAAVDGIIGDPAVAYVRVYESGVRTAVLGTPIDTGATGAWAVSCWVYVSGIGASDIVSVLGWTTDGSRSAWEVVVDNVFGTPRFAIWHREDTETSGATGRGVYIDGEGWHHVLALAAQDGADFDFGLVVDGDANIGTTTSETIGAMTTLKTQSPSPFWGSDIGTIGDVALAHLAVYDHEPAGDHWQAGRGYTGETASARVERLCDEAGITATIDAGDSEPMGPQPALSMRELLLECEAADRGRLGETTAGGLRYTPRSARYNATPWEIPFTKLRGLPSARSDLSTRVGDVTVERSGGSSARVVDQAVLDSGGSEDSQTLNVETDDRLRPLAGWILALGSVDGPGVGQVDLELSVDGGSLVAGWLAASADQPIRLLVTGVPGIPDGLDVFVEGWTERPQSKTWLVSLAVSPARPYDLGVLADDADEYGFLDCGACTIAEDLTTTETGIDVGCADACYWTHADGDFDIVIGGEVMTVTGVSAAGGVPGAYTQTLTVTRSVNGVVKTHTTGADVHVAQPFLLAP